MNVKRNAEAWACDCEQAPLLPVTMLLTLAVCSAVMIPIHYTRCVVAAARKKLRR